MINLRSVYTIWYRDVLLRWRDKIRIIGTLGQPLIFLVVFGSGLGGSLSMLTPGMNFTQFIFPGIISMTVLMTSFMSAMSIVWDREFGFLKEVLVAPISRASVVLGKSLGGATIATCQGALMLVLAPLLQFELSLKLVALLLPLMLIVGWALNGLGILIASRMKSMESFMVVMQMLIMPIIFLSGVFFPVNNLPWWLNAVVKVNPATYGVDAIRQLMLGLNSASDQSILVPAASISVSILGHPMTIVEEIIVVVAFGIITLGVALWSFSLQD